MDVVNDEPDVDVENITETADFAVPSPGQGSDVADDDDDDDDVSSVESESTSE